jgi:hypothetical protein
LIVALPTTIKDALDARGLLTRIPLSPTIDALLAGLHSTAGIASGDDVGRGHDLTLKANQHLGFLALDLVPPATPFNYRLITDPVAKSFRFWLVLNDTPPAKKLFAFATGAAGVLLTPASYQADGDEERLVVAPGDASIAGVAVAILIEGNAGEPATMRLSPTVGQPAGIVELQLVPPTVLIGGSGFGIELPGTAGKPGAFVIDDSTDAAPAGQTVLNGAVVPTRADDPAWRGLAVRHARFYLPSGVPLLGGHAVDAYVEVGTAPGEGIDLAISTSVPAKGSRPRIDVTIECRDPTASGLQDFIPTLVEASMELPLDGMHQDAPSGGFDLLAGRPVIARARFARSVAEPETRITLSVESQGPEGVLSVVAPQGQLGARVLITAAALAAAIVADKAPAGADTGAVILHELLVAALGLSAALKNKGRLTIHKVELASSGHGLPVGENASIRVDYSLDVLVQPIDIGVLSVQMRDEQPMRVRNRNVGLRINLSNPAASGVQTVELDFRAADMEIEDPGAWQVAGPASLFDILGTRSGRGSTWLEVDLRFKLNLGPVRISGATIRATLNDNGSVTGSLRGLEASLVVPGAIDGRGSLALLEGGGFSAALDVRIIPLNLSTDGIVVYQPMPQQNSFWLFVQIGADFPGPIPIANTGLGIYGISGAFGVNARPRPPAQNEPDPIGYQLRWDSSHPLTAFEFRGDDLTIGAQAVIGTVPDLGFSFSGRAGLFVTVPDIVVRGALWATVLSPRMGVTDQPPADGAPGLHFMGVVVVDASDGVTIGLKGELSVPVLLHVVVPLGAHFPTGAGQSDNWYVYLGADGYPADGRGLGPMRAEVLPDLIGLEADAYVMFRGRGMHKWPRGGPITIADGLVIAFGFGYDAAIGEKPIAWADIHARADILLATHPLTLAGFGAVGGSLNLGPFSVGVDATLSLLAVENSDPYVHARLCGHIDLFFTEVEGCVEISIHNQPTLTVPPPDVHPLDDVQNGRIMGDRAFLIDDKYRRIGRMARSPEDIGPHDQVWPDTLLHLAFAISPNLAPGYVAITRLMPLVKQFTPIDLYPCGLAAKPVGNDMLRYEWTLNRLALLDVTGDVHGSGKLVAGPMSAAWQAGKDGDLGTRPQAGDLVLLTYQGDLFLDRLADAGAGLPVDPLVDASTACQREVNATVGWAVGYAAAPVAETFILPADPIAPDPCISRFTASLTQYASILPEIPLAINTAALMPPPYDFTSASLETFTPPLMLEREFAGALDLAVVSGPAAGPVVLMRVQPIQTAMLRPEQPLFAARLWLLVHGVGRDDLPVTVVDNRAETWSNTDRTALPLGKTAVRFAPVSAGWVEWVEIRWQAGLHLAIVGLGGITAAAQAAAAARNAARQAEAQRQADAAAKQPQQDGEVTGAGVHAVLQPGRTYRLDVGMVWEGWLYQQDENGNKQEAAHEKGRADYLPKGGGNPSTDRSFFFRTTPKPKPAGGIAPVALPKYGDATYVASIHVRRDLFDPQMLARFLLGYTPGQTEYARFCDDPLNVHFSAAHVTALAKVYGYTLKLGLRRADAPGADGDAVELNPKWIALQEPHLLKGADPRRLQVASTAMCPMVKPGGTLQSQHPLATQAWYELYALAKSDDPAVLDGRLDGVTFRTSRWRNPAEMLAGIGFKASPASASGDIEVKQLPGLGAPIIDGSDADFEAALDAIGLDGWPAAAGPRASIVWLRQDRNAGPSWQCAGLLLESPEPIDRPGRVELHSLRLVMQPLPAGAFDIRRSDRTRSRLLWLCSAPFVPHAWLQRVLFRPPRRVFPTILLELTDKASGALLSGAMQLPLAPSFAEEA